MRARAQKYKVECGPIQREVLAKNPERAVLACLKKYPIPEIVAWAVCIRLVAKGPKRFAYMGHYLTQLGIIYVPGARANTLRILPNENVKQITT
jgi:hypothetical protein